MQLVLPLWALALILGHLSWELPLYVVVGPGLLAAILIAAATAAALIALSSS